MCIITVGVYSLTTVQLTISGSLGYVQSPILSHDDTGYHIQMGEYQGTKLRWYPFAKLDSNGNVIEKVADSTLDNTKELQGTYYFISEKVLWKSAFNESGYTGNKSDNYGLDYNGSTVQQYLTTTLLTELSISSSRAYRMITPRDLPGEDYTYSDQDGNSTTYTTNDTPNQKLWLLNDTEIENIEVDGKYWNAPSLISTGNNGWWLRFKSGTSYVAYSSFSSFVSSVGWYVNAASVIGSTISGYYAENDAGGIRPAFQITIS